MSGKSGSKKKDKEKEKKEKKKPLDPVAEAALLEKKKAEEEEKKAIDDIPHQVLIKSRVVDVNARNTRLENYVQEKKQELSRKEEDISDVLKYLEAEVRRKDLLTKSLSKELKELSHSQYMEKLKQHDFYRDEISQSEVQYHEKEQELLLWNKKLMQQLSDLQLFVKLKNELRTELDRTKKLIEKNEKRHVLQMKDLEERFLLAKNKLEKEANERIEQSRKAYKEEVSKELDIESHAVKQENTHMKNELKFHEETAQRLQRENEKLEATISALQVELNSLKAHSKLLSQSGLKQNKLLDSLTAKNQTMQQTLFNIQEEWSKEKESLKKEQENRKIPLLLQKEKLLKLIQQKENENRLIAQHTQTIESQRNDVEIYFLEALNQVRAEILARRHLQYEEELALYQSKVNKLLYGHTVGVDDQTKVMTPYIPSGVKLPAIEKDPRLPPPVPPSNVVELEDFTFEDREKVLRLLFIKLNQAQPQWKDEWNKESNVSRSRPTSSTSTALTLSRPASSSLSRPRSGTKSRPLSGVKNVTFAAELTHELNKQERKSLTKQELYPQDGTDDIFDSFLPRGDTPHELL